jgi:hypothetical protein
MPAHYHPPVAWLAGPFAAVVAVLAAGAVLKALKPADTARALSAFGLPGSAPAIRLLSVVEVVIAAGALLLGNRLLATLVALSYAGFAAFVVVALRRELPLATCGCFGAVDSPPTPLHVVLNVLAAAVAGAVALDGGWAPVTVIADQPLGGLPFLVLTATAAYLMYLCLTLLPHLRASGFER